MDEMERHRLGRRVAVARRHDNRVATFELAPGTHTLTIAYREDGPSLDRVLVTNDLAFRPTGAGRQRRWHPPAPTRSRHAAVRSIDPSAAASRGRSRAVIFERLSQSRIQVGW